MDDLQETAYVPDPSLPPAVIFDIDGTLADNSWRSPYDLTAVRLDPPKRNAVAYAHLLQLETVVQPVFVSGRFERVRADTLAWLGEQMLHGPLFMRPEKDRRPDHVIKHEILHRDIAPRWHVLHAIDDRQRIVDMWRRIGIECWQVAEGAF